MSKTDFWYDLGYATGSLLGKTSKTALKAAYTACYLIGQVVVEGTCWLGRKAIETDWSGLKQKLNRRYKIVAQHPTIKAVENSCAQIYLRLPPKWRLILEGSLLVVVPAAALKAGFFLPDKDIELFGIRWHRLWFFHSALGFWLLKKFFDKYNQCRDDRDMLMKLVAALGGAAAIGVGLHLAKDALVDGGKSVVFGIPGLLGINTIIPGTFIDDDAFLLANSLWAFKISKDFFVYAFGDDYGKVKEYVQRNYLKTPERKICKWASRGG
ncbi:MAG: hypothetical protein AB1330_01000 [Bacillota bacterium]